MYLSILFLSVALAADAAAASLAIGAGLKRVSWRQLTSMAICFGFFQGLMPLLGAFLGWLAQDWLDHIDHWLAAGLLSIVALGMLRENKAENCVVPTKLTHKRIIFLAIATSIDAFAAGPVIVFVGWPIFGSAVSIAVVTTILSAIAIRVGFVCGCRLGRVARLVGALLLLFLATGLLVKHLQLWH